MPSLYDQIGEDKLSDLVMTFYDIIETEPYAEDLHLLHLRGHGVTHSRIEQLNFLSGFLGGPQHYVRKFGHANLHRIHEHIEIGPRQRQLWLDCMAQAVEQVGLPADLGAKLMKHLTKAVVTIGERGVGVRKDAVQSGATEPAAESNPPACEMRT